MRRIGPRRARAEKLVIESNRLIEHTRVAKSHPRRVMRVSRAVSGGHVGESGGARLIAGQEKTGAGLFQYARHLEKQPRAHGPVARGCAARAPPPPATPLTRTRPPPP